MLLTSNRVGSTSGDTSFATLGGDGDTTIDGSPEARAVLWLSCNVAGLMAAGLGPCFWFCSNWRISAFWVAIVSNTFPWLSSNDNSRSLKESGLAGAGIVGLGLLTHCCRLFAAGESMAGGERGDRLAGRILGKLSAVSAGGLVC